MRLKTLTLIFITAFTIISCESREPQIENNNGNGGGNGGSEMTFSFDGVDYKFKHAVSVSYGEENPGEYNYEIVFHNGSSPTAQDYTAALYFDVLSSDANKIGGGNYSYDENWQLNTFDYGELEIVSGGNSTYYDVVMGGFMIQYVNGGDITSSISIHLDKNGNNLAGIGGYYGSITHQ